MNISLFHTYGLSLCEKEKNDFSRFLELFIQYNSHTNLSAIRRADDIIEKHFIDSLFGRDFLKEKNLKTIIDIGSGGGFPGIPLKIAYPECDMTLLDSVNKKTKAQKHFCDALGLENIRSIWARAENINTLPEYKGKYDVALSRATAYIDTIIKWAVPFVKKNGFILLYKIPSPDEQKEIPKLLKKYHLSQKKSIKYTLAGQERAIFIFQKKK